MPYLLDADWAINALARKRGADTGLQELSDAGIAIAITTEGQLISDFDILAAATALEHDLVLLTFNRRHFEPIPGLALHPADE